MKKNQFLLLKLAEECVEVAQRCSKQIQFGKDEAQKGQSETNAERLRSELFDLLAVAFLLEQAKEFKPLFADDFGLVVENKREKMNKYLKLSHELGELPEIKL